MANGIFEWAAGRAGAAELVARARDLFNDINDACPFRVRRGYFHAEICSRKARLPVDI